MTCRQGVAMRLPSPPTFSPLTFSVRQLQREVSDVGPERAWLQAQPVEEDLYPHQEEGGGQPDSHHQALLQGS